MIERRQARRARLEGPVEIRPVDSSSGAQGNPIVGQIRDVSLNGVYCSIKEPCELKPQESVFCSIKIPQDQTRFFPFNRLQGRGWVVRVDQITAGRRAGESHADERPLMGLVVAFSPDVTVLSTIAYPA